MVNVDDLKGLKSRDRFYFDCDYCGKRHSSVVKYLRQNAQVTGKKSFHKYCSSECAAKANELENRVCEYCGKKYKPSESKSKYCSRECSNKDSRVCSEKRKAKVKRTMEMKHLNEGTLISTFDFETLYPQVCEVCGEFFLHTRKNRTCSSSCAGALRLLTKQEKGVEIPKRSKAEIELFNLMSQDHDCEHNKPIFNGFDADIIIHALKLAIEWNGPWHYKKMMESHSLKAVKIKDRKKVREVLKKGYRILIIKDFENDMTPRLAYERILDSIKNHSFNKTVFA